MPYAGSERTPSRPAGAGAVAAQAGRDGGLTAGGAGGVETLAGDGDGDGELAVGSSRLGRLYVLHKLAEGGMGVVYVGYDEVLDRRVAVKLLRRVGAAREWLLREAQTLARLSHPNVVAVHDVGEQDGRLFLTMELVEGPTLRAWLEAEPRPFAAVLRLFLEAGRALAAAHAAGIVHRDFKPDNVLVDRDGRARVVDFGIAALAAPEALGGNEGARHALAGPLTHSGALVGTPAYMAPEQFRGDRATHASDQWSFCAALYGAAFGVSPFATEDVDQLRRRVLHEAPAPPPRRADVPPWLAPILLRGLERDAAARFASMDELLEAIEGHLPRDPELDPTVVVRDRQALSGVFLVGFVLSTAPMLADACARVMLRPRWLVGQQAATLAVTVATVAWRWPSLSRNRYGRQIAGLFVGASAALLGHRIIALRLGLPPNWILVEDIVLMTTLYSVVAQLQDRWLGWLAALCAVAAVAGSQAPARVPTIVGLLGLGNVAAMAVRLYLDRHLVPEATVNLRDAQRSTRR